MANRKTKKGSTWFTTGRVAQLLQVTPETVANWVRRGQLKAGTTPGGHYRVHVENLVRFCEEHGFEISEELKQSVTPPTVLIIDDDPEIIKSLVPLLKKEGRIVLGTSDIAEAGMMLMKHKPDLIILDLHMPGTDGVKIATMLREQSELAGTRIIVLSGFIDPFVRSTMKDLRVDKYIDKPPNFKELLQAVDELLVKAREDSVDEKKSPESG